MAKNKLSNSSTKWMQEHFNDEFVKKACEDEHEEVIANRQARFHNLIGDMADDEIEEVEANQEFVN